MRYLPVSINIVKIVTPLLAVVAVLSGCGDRDQVMGRTAGTPVPEPQKVHCDLIFPGTDRR